MKPLYLLFFFQKLSLPKKRSMSVSSDSDSSSDEESSDIESSDAASSTSENLPLSTFVESSSTKGTLYLLFYYISVCLLAKIFKYA